MYVVIAGGGKVGRSIAVDLLADGHEVTIIELVEARCEQLLRDHDLLVIHGDACDVRYLQQAKLERADVFVATTGSDDANFVAAQLARTSFEVPRIISRVNSPQNEDIFARLNIEAVSTTNLISRLIRDEVTVGDLVHIYTLRRGAANLVEIDVPAEADSPGPQIAQMHLPRETVIVCVFRDDDTIIPHGQTHLMPGDQLIVITKPEFEQQMRKAIAKGWWE